MNDHEPSLATSNGHADTSLGARLTGLAQRLVQTPPTDDEGAAELVALLPAEPHAGQVVVACWQTQGGASVYDLVRFDGTRVDDAGALREALVLVAAAEALEELAEPLRVREVVDLLLAWQESLALARGDAEVATVLDASRAQEDELATAVWGAVEQLQLLERERASGSADDPEPRTASPALIERLAQRLDALEQAWRTLETHAERWSQTVHDAQPVLVQRLWAAIAAARQGPLAQPARVALEAGRAAGAALAEDVLRGARPGGGAGADEAR